MHKSTYLIILLLSSIGIFAQEERSIISGKIKSDIEVLKDIHIINETSNKGVVSNDNGTFSISVKINDTLIFRGIQFERKQHVISKIDINNKSILVELTSKTNILNEVNIRKPENLAMALNLPNAGKVPLKGVDLKLAYYSQKSTPIVILEMLLGKKGGIDDLYNIISGNRKKHRKLKALIEADKLLEQNKKVFSKLRKHFKDDFFIYTLKIPSKNIDEFIKYCEPKDIIDLFYKERFLEVTDVLLKEAKTFLTK